MCEEQQRAEAERLRWESAERREREARDAEVIDAHALCDTFLSFVINVKLENEVEKDGRK